MGLLLGPKLCFQHVFDHVLRLGMTCHGVVQPNMNLITPKFHTLRAHLRCQLALQRVDPWLAWSEPFDNSLKILTFVRLTLSRVYSDLSLLSSAARGAVAGAGAPGVI